MGLSSSSVRGRSSSPITPISNPSRTRMIGARRLPVRSPPRTATLASYTWIAFRNLRKTTSEPCRSVAKRTRSRFRPAFPVLPRPTGTAPPCPGSLDAAGAVGVGAHAQRVHGEPHGDPGCLVCGIVDRRALGDHVGLDPFANERTDHLDHLTR